MTDAARAEVRFCARCLYGSDHPLGLTIDDEGICSGCQIHEEKDRLDWAERWRRLEQLVKPYRSRDGRNYDCIVPVTGGQESYWVVHVVKERLGLSPLLVTYNRYFNTALGIRNLANLRIRYNCDILIQNVNPLAVKKITRATLRRFGSIYWPCLAGQTVFPVQTAVSHRVPLIIWGGHQGNEQVGMFSHDHEVQMTRRYRKDHDLMGYEPDDLLAIGDTLREEDVWQYRYPDDGALAATGVVGIYLSNYVRWDPKAQDEAMISRSHYRTCKSVRTFDTYEHTDCFNYLNLHDQLKLYKHGYSKVTDHATREIRHGRLTRAEGEAMVRHAEEQPPQHVDLFREWLGTTRRGLQYLLDLSRNRKYWTESEPGCWQFRGWSRLRTHVASVPADVDCIEARLGFVNNDRNDRNQPPRYVTIGKGYPD